MSLHRIRLVTVLAVVLVVLLPAAHVSAQLDRLLKGLSQESASADLSDAKIASGLREALRVGTQNAVNLTGKTDGYFLNQAIKILMPEKLQTLEQGLRAFGYGSQVEELVLSMNRAAEQSAPAAKQIFGNAIAAMSFEDARKILKGRPHHHENFPAVNVDREIDHAPHKALDGRFFHIGRPELLAVAVARAIR